MKLCENCNKALATLFLTQVDGEELTTKHICQKCAKELGIPLANAKQMHQEDDFEDENFEDNDDEFLDADEYDEVDEITEDFEDNSDDIVEIPVTAKVLKEISAEDTLSCARCGKKETDFEKDYIAGCVKCFSTFVSLIEKKSMLLKGNYFYEGKQYRQSNSRSFKSELEQLKTELNSAIKQQKFELASVLRDRVNELELRSKK